MLPHLSWGKFPEKPIDAEKLKQLAAAGKKRSEISKAFSQEHSRFWRKVNISQSLSEAFTEGRRIYEESKNA